jgi:hypothetical protein
MGSKEVRDAHERPALRAALPAHRPILARAGVRSDASLVTSTIADWSRKA